MTPRVLFSHRARRVFIWLHLWLGLILGAWFSLIGVSGSILAWRTELGAAELNRRFPIEKPSPDAKLLSIAQAKASLKRSMPDFDFSQISGISVPGTRSAFYAFSVGRNRRTARTIVLHPYSGAVLGTVAPRTGTVATIQQFHQRLIAGTRGYVFNGLLTVLAIPLLLSGLWLWWPSNGKQLRARLTVKRGTPIHRRLYDLHNVMGIYLYGALFVTTLTGALLVANHIQRDGLAQTWQELVAGEAPNAGGERSRAQRAERGQREERGGSRGRGENRGGEGGPRDNAPTVVPQGERLSDDVLLETARKSLPDYQITRVQLPPSPDQPFAASYSVPTGFATNRTLYLNPYTGAVLPSETPGANYNSVVRGLHLGDFGGVLVKILYTLTGLMPLGLFLTGVWMWARKKAKSRARHSAKTATA